MKRIYFLLPHYPLWFDGANKYHTKVYEYFKSKYEFVFTFGRTVHVKQSRYRIISKLNKLFHIIGLITGLIYIFRIPKHSLLIINSSHFFHYIIPLSINKYWKKHKYFLIVHDLVQKERPTYLRKKFENYFIQNSDKVVANSSMTKKDLISLNLVNQNTEIIYPGLDVDFKKAFLKKTFSSKFRLLFVGSIEKRKGILYLIDALAQLKNLDFELNLIGVVKSPDYYDILINRINDLALSDKVHFHGRVSSEELVTHFLNSSVFVFPTLYEGYGMAIAEAMAYGLPVISTKIPAIEEFLENGKEGELVESGNSNELYNSLKKLFENSALLSFYSENALKKSKTFKSWNEICSKYWYIIKEEYIND